MELTSLPNVPGFPLQCPATRVRGVGGAPCYSHMAATDDLREQGNAAFRNGDFLKAAAAYTKAIKADPANAVLYSNRSLALLKLNKLSKALADAEQCTKLDPSNVKGWYRQAQVLELQGHLEQAIRVLREGSEATVGGAGDQELTRQIRNLTRQLKGRVGSVNSSSGGVSGDGAAAGANAGGASAAWSAVENGGKAPFSPAEAQALAFADAWIQYAQEQLVENGSDFAPTIHFLPGDKPNTPDCPHPAASIQGAKAFTDPAMLAEFVNFVRQTGEELGAKAVVSIIPKSQVAFPQIWLQPLWPYARDQDGVFVQLQALIPAPGSNDTNRAATAEKAPSKESGKAAGSKAAGSRRQRDVSQTDADQEVGGSAAAGGGGQQVQKLWFVRLAEGKVGAGVRARTPHELPHDLALLPSLLR